MKETQAAVNLTDRQLQENHTLRALEWDRFMDWAEEFAYSAPAKSRIQSLRKPEDWAQSLAAAQGLQQETLEVSWILEKDALWGPLDGLTDLSPILERLEKGAVLELTELMVLKAWLSAIDAWTQIPLEEIKGERLKKSLRCLPHLKEPLGILEKILTSSGELSEQATPRLSGLFSELRGLKREISHTLEHLLKSYGQKGVLQENFFDVRDGRYVLPVKVSAQNEMEGILYDSSASGQTVFIEPREIEKLNHQLRLKQNQLQQEIYSVLEQTSQKLQPHTTEIHPGFLTLTFWDSTQAKARFGRKYSGKTIRISEERRFALKQTAHPLLWASLPGEQIIRNDLEFGAPFQTLLLTGPNTGGKTVLLKTLGLAGLCARSGFPFPASETPVVPFFDSFFADLGDPQSIERHLSSFSGHVLLFKSILEQITPQSLILMDELNSATDPEEGAAFGRAVLETLMAQQVMTVTTTHDPKLKALAVTDPRILNASMAFDESSRSPTFKMLLGVPGRSRALETAERLGIPQSVIQLARSYLSQEHRDLEDQLSRLEADSLEAARAKKEALQLQKEAEQLKQQWIEKTTHSFEELVHRSRQKLRKILEHAQDEVRASVRRLDEAKSRKDVDLARSSLNQILEQSTHEMTSLIQEEAPEVQNRGYSKKDQPQEPSEGTTLQVGSKVRILKWKSTGEVTALLGEQVQVNVGTLRVTLQRKEVELLAEPTKKAPPVHAAFSLNQTALQSKIDLRGLRFEEAMRILQQSLDQAYFSGAVEVQIIHGLGTGALREGSLRLLRKLPYIKEFRDAGTSLGGAGATIVEFERH
ncbi:MAG: endonuclease MutS2 [Bdellovibrionia bacterium]